MALRLWSLAGEVINTRVVAGCHACVECLRRDDFALAAREATLETPPEGYGYIFHVDNASCDLAFELGEVVRMETANRARSAQQLGAPSSASSALLARRREQSRSRAALRSLEIPASHTNVDPVSDAVIALSDPRLYRSNAVSLGMGSSSFPQRTASGASTGSAATLPFGPFAGVAPSGDSVLSADCCTSSPPADADTFFQFSPSAWVCGGVAAADTKPAAAAAAAQNPNAFASNPAAGGIPFLPFFAAAAAPFSAAAAPLLDVAALQAALGLFNPNSSHHSAANPAPPPPRCESPPLERLPDEFPDLGFVSPSGRATDPWFLPTDTATDTEEMAAEPERGASEHKPKRMRCGDSPPQQQQPAQHATAAPVPVPCAPSTASSSDAAAALPCGAPPQPSGAWALYASAASRGRSGSGVSSMDFDDALASAHSDATAASTPSPRGCPPALPRAVALRDRTPSDASASSDGEQQHQAAAPAPAPSAQQAPAPAQQQAVPGRAAAPRRSSDCSPSVRFGGGRRRSSGLAAQLPPGYAGGYPLSDRPGETAFEEDDEPSFIDADADRPLLSELYPRGLEGLRSRTVAQGGGKLHGAARRPAPWERQPCATGGAPGRRLGAF